ncbi:MAG: hypothetical protein U0637_12590 [Phycisphaerales bacterium]
MNFFSMWRSTRVLDGRRVGGAARTQSVVHALLSAKDQVPLQAPPEDLRRRIAYSLEGTRPFTLGAGEAWLAGTVKGGVLAVLLLSLAGVVIWKTSVTARRYQGALTSLPLDHDDPDPDPDLIAQEQAGGVQRAEPLVDEVRPRTSFAVRAPTPEQAQAQKDFEKIASTFMQAFPVRQEDPR